MKEELEGIITKLGTYRKSKCPLDREEKKDILLLIEEAIENCEVIIGYAEYVRKEVRVFPSAK